MKMKQNSEILNSKRAIAYACSSKFYEILGVSIISLQRTNFDVYDSVVVFEYDFSDEQKNFLKQIEPRCVFYHYSLEDYFDELGINDNSDVDPIYKLKHASMSYGKHVALRLLDNYEKVLFIEPDMVFRGDISDIFEGNHCAYTNYYNLYEHLNVTDDSEITMLGFAPNEVRNMWATNGGLFYLDSTVIDKNLALDFILKLKKNFIHAPIKHGRCVPIRIDEVCLAYVINVLSKKVRLLNYRIYNSLPNRLGMRDDAKIVHLFYNYKPWSNPQILEFFPEWKESYLCWLKNGGNQIDSLHLEKRILSLQNNLINERLIIIYSHILSKYSSCLTLSNSLSNTIFVLPFTEQIKKKSLHVFKFLDKHEIDIYLNKMTFSMSVIFNDDLNEIQKESIEVFLNNNHMFYKTKIDCDNCCFNSIEFSSLGQFLSCLDFFIERFMFF